MNILRVVAAFAVGGIATSNLLVVAVPPTVVVSEPQSVHLAAVVIEEVIEDTAPVPEQGPEIVPEPLAPVYTGTSSIYEQILLYAQKYGVSAARMESIVSCETAGTFDPMIRSEAIYTYSDPRRGIVAGEREQSYGLAQIHIPDNSGVTIEEATDPHYALDFMARELARGNGSWRWRVCYHSRQP